MGEPNIAELAVAAWRLERWLDNLNAERKMAAKKSIREIKKYLDVFEIEIVDPVGWKFDPGLAVEVVNNEAEDIPEEELIIIQTNSPIVKQDGSVIQYGKVILGREIKEQKANNEVKSPEEISQSEKIEVTSENESTLSQGPIYIGNYGGHPCWVRQFNCKAVKDGYYALIGVFSNVDTEICLMDEQVYKEYQNGLVPRSPFVYKPKAGAAYIAPPYPDIWYMIVWPSLGTDCIENRFDSNCEWKKKLDEVRNNGNVPGKDQTSNVSEKSEITAQGETGAKAPGASQQLDKDVQASQKADSDSETKRKDVPDMSDKEFERMKKKNLSSFYTRSAVDRGLFQIHGKKQK